MKGRQMRRGEATQSALTPDRHQQHPTYGEGLDQERKLGKHSVRVIQAYFLCDRFELVEQAVADDWQGKLKKCQAAKAEVEKTLDSLREQNQRLQSELATLRYSQPSSTSGVMWEFQGDSADTWTAMSDKSDKFKGFASL